jgi:hypothetical protein
MRYDDEHIKAELERAIAMAGGVRRLADRCGLTASFISQVRLGQSAPGPKLAEYLGYVEDGRRWVEKR